jgi:hypothetical protein
MTIDEIILAAYNAWTLDPDYEDGRYNYGFGPIVEDDSAKYNLMRHLGIKWVRNEIMVNYGFTYEEFDPYLKKAWKGSYFLETKPCVYKRGSSTRLVFKKNVLLGAQGLGLMAFPNLAEPICKFILSCQLPNHDFIHKLNKYLYPLEFRSEYYTGEALLALSRAESEELVSDELHTLIKERKLKAFQYLNTLDYGVESMSHWMFWALTEDTDYDILEKEIWLLKIINYIIKNKELYRSRDYSAPTACKIEGLMRAAHYFGPGHSITPIIMEHLKYDIEFLIKCFDGKHFLHGLSDKNRVQWRMDYNQHSIFGLWLYKKFCNRYRYPGIIT